jgi:hypothetical protein
LRTGIRAALFASAAIFRDLYPLAVAAPETIDYRRLRDPGTAGGPTIK